MKKFNYLIALFLLISISFISCNNDDDETREPLPETPDLDFSTVSVQDFIWQGMNLYYLWKDNVSNLSNSKDDNDESYFNLLNSSDNPDDFFESLQDLDLSGYVECRGGFIEHHQVGFAT